MSRVTPQTGEIFHVYNRGTDKRTIFTDAFDIDRFLLSMILFNNQNVSGGLYDHFKSGGQTPRFDTYLRKWYEQERFEQKPLVRVLGYCILPNHYHMLLEQLVDGGISEFLKRIGNGYTLGFNSRYERTGVLFQGIYKRILVDSSEYLQYLLAYISCNQVVHQSTFAFPLPARLVGMVSSRSQYEEGSMGICDTALLQMYVKNNMYWKEAEKLAMKIRANRDLEKLTIEEKQTI